jgi:hypothetical protein
MNNESKLREALAVVVRKHDEAVADSTRKWHRPRHGESIYLTHAERDLFASLVAATPDTPPGEYHAEGMDERGIYGGRAHDPAAPDTTQEPPRYEGGSLKRDAPWRES